MKQANSALLDSLLEEQFAPRRPRPLSTAEAQIYIAHELNGVTIRQRRDDDYIDVTAICRAGGKLFAHWRENEGTDRYLAFIAETIGIPIVDLTQSTEGRGGGTFAEKHVALAVAAWVSAEFQFYVFDWFWQTAIAGRQADLTGAGFETRRLVKTFQDAAAPQPPVIDEAAIAGIADKLADMLVDKGIATRGDITRGTDAIRDVIREITPPVRQQLDRLETNIAATHKRVKRIDRTTTSTQLEFWHKEQLERAGPLKVPSANASSHRQTREAKPRPRAFNPQTSEIKRPPLLGLGEKYDPNWQTKTEG